MVARKHGIVLSIVGGKYRVFSNGETLDASLRGRMKRRQEIRVLVGDDDTARSDARSSHP